MPRLLFADTIKKLHPSGVRGLLEVGHFQDAAHVDTVRADELGEIAGVLDRFRQ